uniref:Uncharacterized protein n=1 Tax=Panagrolaimus superbus TaxID=310955 RepID=A0A914YPR4_9BILA
MLETVYDSRLAPVVPSILVERQQSEAPSSASLQVFPGVVPSYPIIDLTGSSSNSRKRPGPVKSEQLELERQKNRLYWAAYYKSYLETGPEQKCPFSKSYLSYLKNQASAYYLQTGVSINTGGFTRSIKGQAGHDSLALLSLRYFKTYNPEFGNVF